MNNIYGYVFGILLDKVLAAGSNPAFWGFGSAGVAQSGRAIAIKCQVNYRN